MDGINNVSNNQMEIREALVVGLAEYKIPTNAKNCEQEESLIVNKGIDYISLKARMDSLVSGVREVKEALSSQKFHQTYLNSLYYVLDQIQKIKGKVEASCLADSDKNSTIEELNKCKSTLRRLSSLYLSKRFREVCLKNVLGDMSLRVPLNLYKHLNGRNTSVSQLISGIEALLEKDLTPCFDPNLKANSDLLSLKNSDPSLFFVSYKDLEKESVVRLLK